ncbi:MAG TPA: hypothetical protein VGV59_13740 [Pyrinomonadaceae bacterium]|nr:hypothetical protein [Pyrinomonadaceae bacterium]
MPVIGRLDKQVDDVLIAPVSKNRPPAPAPTRDEADEPSQTPDRDEPAVERRRQPPDETLPVWLL